MRNLETSGVGPYKCQLTPWRVAQDMMKFPTPLSALLVLFSIQIACAQGKNKAPNEVNRVTLDGETYINKVRDKGIRHWHASLIAFYIITVTGFGRVRPYPL